MRPGRVTLKPEPSPANMNNLLALQIADVAFHEFLSVGVLVESGKKLVPLVLAQSYMNLWNHGTVVHIVECSLPVHFISIVLVFTDVCRLSTLRLFRIHE